MSKEKEQTGSERQMSKDELKARAEAAGMSVETVARLTGTGVFYCVTSGPFRSLGFVPGKEKDALSELMHAMDDMIYTFMSGICYSGVSAEKTEFVLDGLVTDAKKRFLDQRQAADDKIGDNDGETDEEDIAPDSETGAKADRI